ncbi:Cu(I)/Ag(I) efflux system membrane protein CusA/SilA [Roseivirga pacifica]|uniref:Cu(I)/Ag(I) efflux system membrane protein CusA/SilA n=1 Tax=Roseivirga pacifica TaxID=1267423 RepID=A0A1I0NX56_9BACT|nr:efflux RND transporter permease subunit [Roseivirga pacifica]RKQ51517.1 Cu(I)/Ag(I) efflux system membrane protein CusA/SilA [Roseivirga pacifica]SEW06104.1 Cu(I)/Ag(I) efflux system membrane protein CusA/SilA [Roseivirga pacifica]
MINTLIKFFLENRLVTFLLIVLLVGWGLVTAPFSWNTGLPKDPVPVDAIPDIGENQQIVFTEWAGQSPQDIEDQITYPLTSSLLGIPGVKTIRSSSIFGVSSIYIIFNEDVEFYWSRSRVLEKLNALPKGLLPDGVQPALGPDATALGQIFWYTIEGRDENGQPTGGWDPQEIRTVQDYNVRYGLAAAEGVSEVASVGGFVKEYQVDIDPTAMEGYGVTLTEIVKAVKESNLDVGAKTLEVNQAEYLVRGLGYIKNLEDLENAVVKANENTPILLKDVAFVNLGPASRRGALDKSGAEAVGGVVVARYGANPLEVIENVKAKIEAISSGLPSKILSDGTKSQLTIVPFYDRTQLIKETIGTLEEALTLEIIITIVVVLVMLLNLRASLLISSLLPIAVLMCFVAMRYLGVDANIVALSGIAIAIGTMVDVGIVLTENISRHMEEQKSKTLLDTIYTASKEVAPAIITAVMTTVVSFVPVFTLQASEGKLFRPLAYTKTFALIAAILVALLILPTLAYWFFGFQPKSKWSKIAIHTGVSIFGIWVLVLGHYLAAFMLLGYGLVGLVKALVTNTQQLLKHAEITIALIGISILLSQSWLPLGVQSTAFTNWLFVALVIATTLGIFSLFIRFYPRILNWCLSNRKVFLIIPTFVILFGVTIWQGFDRVFGFIPSAFGDSIRTQKTYSKLAHSLPGIGKEFMPSLGEGAFLLMPTSMPHAGIEQNRQVLRMLDMAVTAIPEISSVVGKMGRTESALDPAPISMYENVINYKSEYKTDENGHRIRFKYKNDAFVRDAKGELIPDKNGRYFRQWRDHIQSPDDIWNEIVKATKLPGVTSAPKLQPIETRLVMLQTGMRAPMGIKVKGPDLKTIESFGLELEEILKEVSSVKAEAVFAERIVGKPYLLLELKRDALARYGLSIAQVQQYLQVAIGGMNLSTTVEGRERYPIRVRYPRELRDDPEALKNILIPTSNGKNIPLGEVAQIEYTQGPQMIKSEDTFLVGYVIFDKRDGFAEAQVVEAVQDLIDQKVEAGELNIPAGVSFDFAGNYQNQIRAEQRLSLVIPIVLVIIFLILYFQFKSVPVSLMVFSGVAVAFGGGFIMLWLYGQEGFLNFDLFGTNMRELFQVHPVNLSVAVWVGFIALFGIATDDGVLMATYLDQSFEKSQSLSKAEIKQRVIEAGKKRVRPCLMTTATTLLALLPILTSTGRGSDVMIPMAIPSFGGMAIALITLFVVPVLYSYYKEFQLKYKQKGGLL